MIYQATYFGEDDNWPDPIPDGWIYGGTVDEFGLIDVWMVPMKRDYEAAMAMYQIVEGATGLGLRPAVKAIVDSAYTIEDNDE